MLSAGTYYLSITRGIGSYSVGGDRGVNYVLDIASFALPNRVARIQDTASFNLDGAHSVTTAAVSGTTYLFVSGYNDNGVSVLELILVVL